MLSVAEASTAANGPCQASTVSPRFHLGFTSEKPSEHLDTFLGPILSPTWGKGGKRGRMQPQYTFHDTRLAVEAFSTTLDLGVREGEEAKHATKLVTTQGCKKTVVGETSTNGLGHKSVSEFLPSTAQEVADFYFCGWAICVTFAHTM